MITLYNFGFQSWMNKIIFLFLIDIIGYGLIIQCLNGTESMLQYNNEMIFPNRTKSLYLSFIIDIIIIVTGILSCVYLLIFDKHNLITFVWGILFLIFSFVSSYESWIFFEGGKNESRKILKYDDYDIFLIEKENKCCLDLITPNCGCFDFEGKEILKCKMIENERYCEKKVVHCFKCIEQSNSLFLFTSLHNILVSILILGCTVFIWKKYIQNYVLKKRYFNNDMNVLYNEIEKEIKEKENDETKVKED